MDDSGDTIDVAALGEVFARFLSALEAHRAELDSLNVYPVPDGDTGTNLLFTQRAVMEALDRLDDPYPSAFAEAVAGASLMGARGNSGVILAQVLRGLTERLCAEDGGSGGKRLAEALEHAAEEARRAVARPVQGTALTVLADAAAAAREAAAVVRGTPGAAGPVEAGAAAAVEAGAVADAALAEARESLGRTTEALPELRAAGVVDAGGLGMVLLLDALASVLAGYALTVAVGPSGPVGRAEAPATDGLPFKYEVMYLLHGDDSLIPALRERLDGLGESVVVVGGDGLYKVHVHTNEPEGALEAAREAGRTEDVRTVDLEGEVAEQCLSGQARAVRVGERQASALVVVADGDGLAKLFGSLGALVALGGSGDQPSVEQLVDAIDAAPADSVVVLPNGSRLLAVAERAAAESGKEVRVVPTRSVPEGLSAAVGFNPMSPLRETAERMAEVASDVTAAAVTRAVRDASAWAGDVREGDWLGSVDGDIRVVGPDPVEVALQLLSELRADDHEMLTVILGADASDGDASRLAEALENGHGDLEIQIHRGDQPADPYLFGLE